VSRTRLETWFVDTNVLVYARDASERAKQDSAQHWLEYLWRSRTGRLSHQVLNEYCVVVTEKLQPGLDREQARADVRNLMAWTPLPTTSATIETAWTIQDRHRLAWWDCLIVAAAQIAGCTWLLTEDLTHDRVFEGVRVVDPFRVAPPSAK
jgi:predicted nucleic acid-binding protein